MFYQMNPLKEKVRKRVERRGDSTIGSSKGGEDEDDDVDEDEIEDNDETDGAGAAAPPSENSDDDRQHTQVVL